MVNPLPQCEILPHALKLSIFAKLKGKRVVLASSSPRRKDALETYGLSAAVVPSKFGEDLPKDDFEGRLAEYPVSTAGEKAMEVYERLVQTDEHHPPDLVISADTVVIFPPEKDTVEHGIAHGETSEILEKPATRSEQSRWLNLINGRAVEIVTGITIAYPSIEAPGYKLESISCSTIAYFHESPQDIIDAYVESGEGLDRAGGFSIQGLGGILMERIEGDYDNCVGFPSAQFWRWLSELDKAGVFDDAWDA